MPGIDASIPLGVQSPMQTISGLLNIRSQQQQQELQQQALQSGSMQNQQSSIDLQETQNAMGVMKRIKDYQDPQGNIDFNKLAPDMAQAAPKNWSKFMTGVMQAQQAHTQAVQSVNTLDADTRQQVGKVLYSLKGSKPQVVADTIGNFEKTYPNLTPALDLFRTRAQSVGDNQPALDDLLDQAGRMVEAPPSQQTMQTPSGVTNDDGQNYGVTSVKPGTTVPPGQTIPGTAGTHQLPPTTPTIDPSTGQPGYVGAQGASAQGGPAVFDLSGDRTRDFGMLNTIRNDPRMSPEVRTQAAAKLREMQGGTGSGFTPSALPPGQGRNIENNVDEMNRHFASLQDSSSGAQLVQGLTGNIKALADGAATGTEAGKKAYVSGLLNALHLGNESTGDLQRDTDLLEKNMAQLNMGTPAATDAMRRLVEAGRPHTSMSAPAIKEAADQVASQVKSNMAQRNALQGYKMMGDTAGYASARTKLEQVADPRAWQYAEMSPQEGRAFLSKLTPQDRAQLVQKVQQLEQMGILK